MSTTAPDTIAVHVQHQADKLVALLGGVVYYKMLVDGEEQLVVISGSEKDAGNIPGFADANSIGRGKDAVQYVKKCFAQREIARTSAYYMIECDMLTNDCLYFISGTFGELRSKHINHNDKV